MNDRTGRFVSPRVCLPLRGDAYRGIEGTPVRCDILVSKRDPEDLFASIGSQGLSHPKDKLKGTFMTKGYL